MISIEKITIENFQSHKDTQIIFSDGLNVIIGASDHGKSAIIRAIKWVLYNEPRGNDYIRQGANYAKVTLKMSNGYTITRERTPSKNRYILTDKEKNSSIFEGFGSEVPYEVVSAHGIPKIILDMDKKSCINISEQLEGPFLISESGSLRAKAIGRIAGLHILDKSIKDSATDLRRQNQTKDRLNNELEDIKNKLLDFKDLDMLGKRLEQSKNIIVKLENFINKIRKLESKKLQLKDIGERCLKANKTLLNLDKINEGEIVLKTIELGITKLNRLINIQKRFRNTSESIVKEKEILNKTKDVYYIEEVVKDIDNGSENIKRLKVYQAKYNEFEKKILDIQKQVKACANINEADNTINNIDKMLELEKKLINLNESYKGNAENMVKGLDYINEKEIEIENLLDKYIKILKDKSKCPLCDSLIGENIIGNIVARYRKESK